MSNTSDEPASNASPAQEPIERLPVMTTSPRRKYRRKESAKGMSRDRFREIAELVSQGREDEVSADELEESRRLVEEFAEAARPVTEMLIEQVRPSLNGLQAAARKITERNLNLSRVNASSWLEPEKIEMVAHQSRPMIEPPDMDAIADSMAEAQAEKDAQVNRAQDTADETNNLLTELTRLMDSVESSNRNTERVLVEIKAHREQVAGQQSKQDRINVLLSVAAVLVGLGSIVVPIIVGR